MLFVPAICASTGTAIFDAMVGELGIAESFCPFRYKTNSGQTKFCTLPAEKFIHRSLRVQHVLPKSFVKVRYNVPLVSPCLLGVQYPSGARLDSIRRGGSQA